MPAVSLRSSCASGAAKRKLRCPHRRDAARTNCLGGYDHDRHFGLEEAATPDAVGCRSRCWRDGLELPE